MMLWKKLNCFVTITFLYAISFYLMFGYYNVAFSSSLYLAEKYYWLTYFSSQFIPFMFYNYKYGYAIQHPEILMNRKWQSQSYLIYRILYVFHLFVIFNIFLIDIYAFMIKEFWPDSL